MGLFICFSVPSNYKLPEHSNIEIKLVDKFQKIIILCKLFDLIIFMFKYSFLFALKKYKQL